MQIRYATLLTRRTGNALLSSKASQEKLFDKVLIANRGEIACRVIRSCKKLGIKTVAVYSEKDAESVAVSLADESVCIGPPPSTQSYLNIPRIVEAIKSTGAQAVHPGYGFLSENSKFRQALDDIGVTFIGPEVHALEAMGDKIQSKTLAMNAGVNTIPGFLGVITDEEHAVKISREIGYPVMIKASAGGGGKGMRIAYNDKEARRGYKLSKDEAASSFGDDRLFVEKFIEDPRHIEIQLLADNFGNVLPFPERECSIQRRNQKVIEEAPSVLLDDKTRRAMGEQASMLAKAVGYRSAGTVEFLCDKHKNFYFLEMNTRLQVEHPVTELISGVDLVEQMLRIAAGKPLPAEYLSGPLPIKGWAMESRIYAEDPLRGFLPSIGRLLNYQEPKGKHVRVDSGVTEGSDISMYYDPMIAKLVTHGKTRDECISYMEDALDNYVVRGPGHNIPFLRDLYRHERFRKGNLTTKFIAEEYPDGFHGVQLSKNESLEVIAASLLMHLAKKDIVESIHPKVHHNDDEDSSFYISFSTNSDKSNNITIKAEMDYDENDDEGSYIVSLEDDQGRKNQIKIGKIEWDVGSTVFKANIDGQEKTIQYLDPTHQGFVLRYCGAICPMVVQTPQEYKYSKLMLPKPKKDTSKLLICPMPGMLVSVLVQPGQEVEPGQELAIIEAMKMQNVLRAEKSGKISKINCKQGDSLQVDQIILELE